jgi:dCTP deaminase
MDGFGALPSQVIVEMIESSHIQGSFHQMVQPASLDLALTNEIYRVSSVFCPSPGEKVEDAMTLVDPETFDISTPLEVGVTYLARLCETLSLPDDIYAYADPKSSSGRCDVHTRLLADGVSRFDSIGIRGYCGQLWVLITPRSFRPLLHKGDSLVQIRFFNHDTRFKDNVRLEEEYRRHQFLYDPTGKPIPYNDIRITDNDGGLILTANLDLDVVGYRCERSQLSLDWSLVGHYDYRDFFQPIPRPRNGHLVLRAGDFYILSTAEFIKVPPCLAVEMVAIDTRSGDHRAHYAGFFDPGWGFGPDGVLKGAPAVMEVRSPNDDIVLRDRQPICKMTFECMSEAPDVVYGQSGSNYLNQIGPRLSKHFKPL